VVNANAPSPSGAGSATVCLPVVSAGYLVPVAVVVVIAIIEVTSSFRFYNLAGRPRLRRDANIWNPAP
jgi:hypothetical protein